MKEEYTLYMTIGNPIPAGIVPNLLTELSKYGWQEASLTPVQVQVSKISGAQPQNAYMIMIKKEGVPINATPNFPHISMDQEGIHIIEKPMEDNTNGKI